MHFSWKFVLFIDSQKIVDFVKRLQKSLLSLGIHHHHTHTHTNVVQGTYSTCVLKRYLVHSMEGVKRNILIDWWQ